MLMWVGGGVTASLLAGPGVEGYSITNGCAGVMGGGGVTAVLLMGPGVEGYSITNGCAGVIFFFLGGGGYSSTADGTRGGGVQHY